MNNIENPNIDIKTQFGVDAAKNKPDTESIDEGEETIDLEIKKSIDEVKAQYQEYIDRNRAYFQVFSNDSSLSFSMSNGFSINFETGVINFDTKWFYEHGFSESQITWAVYHELSHFRDLAADEKGILNNFEYIREQARKTGKILMRRYEDKFAKTDPEFIQKISKQKPLDKKRPEKGTMNIFESMAYKYHHTFYNIFDDIYVNNLVTIKSPRFSKRTIGGNEITRLYKEKLFVKNDYTDLPRHLQFLYKMLREEMVPDEPVLVAPEIEKIFTDKIIFQGAVFTPQKIVNSFLKPSDRKDTRASTRYFIIKNTLEPIFEKLLAKDLEEFDPQKPEKKKPGKPGKDGEPGEPEGDPVDDPFEDDYIDDLPDPLNDETIPDWVDNENKRKEAEEKKIKEESKTAEQKKKEVDEAINRKWCADNNITPKEYAKFIEVKKQIAPYLSELAEVWENIIQGKGRDILREMEGYYPHGSQMDIQEVINNGADILRGHNLHNVRVMEKEVEKELPVNRPDLIRVRFVGDMSGSMVNDEKMKVFRQCFVLLMTSLKQFDASLNITRSRTKTRMSVDTEAWTFNSVAKRVKALRTDSPADTDETASIIKVLNTLERPTGNTMDNKALEAIYNTLKPDDLKAIGEKKILDIVFEITDGGSSDENSARIAVDALDKVGVITRAFQIGEVGESETESFNHVWNDGRSGGGFGEVVGTEVKNLIPAIVKALKKYLGNVRI